MPCMDDGGWVARGGGAATDAGGQAPDSVRSRPAPVDYASRFPGCRPVRLLTDRLPDFESRLEYWDARTETAWVVAEPTGGIHEGTSRRLIHLAERIALVRGTPIASFGSVDLLVRDARGAPERMMQADETLYLHPGQARLPQGSLVIGEHDLPDVVLEVDHTTDVRPGKLPLYESWGFPELWVVVPPAGARRRRPAGVTIHRLDEGRYRSAPASRAFPGWTAAEIHTALTEPATTAYTWRALERVGRTLGAREGTGPDDTPLLRSLGEQARAEGRAEELAVLVRSTLRVRGIPVTDGFPGASAALAAVPHDVLMAAALACVDEQDFRRRAGLPD